MPNVIFIETPQHGLANAFEFGDIKVLYPKGVQRPAVFDENNYVTHLLTKLAEENFNPVTDYIAATGFLSQLLISVLAVCEEYGKVNLLLFHSHSQLYIPRTFKEFYHAPSHS